MQGKCKQLGRYMVKDCDCPWLQDCSATEHTTQMTEAELEWVCREWAAHIADELCEEYGQWRTPLIVYAEERLRHFAGTLGKERVYEILVDQVRRIAGADGTRRFYEFWSGFQSLDPRRCNPETPPS